MGVRKYHSVEEMPGPAPRHPLDPENLRIAFGLMELAHRIHGRKRVPGVRKLRSYDRMVQAKDGM